MDINQIIELRLRVADPHGYINIVSVDELPDAPSDQSAYRVDEDVYLDSTGAQIELNLSDSRLESWIETYGINDTECIAYKAIAARLGGALRIKRLSSGSESTEWQSILDLYLYYKQMSEDCTARNKKDLKRNTGIFGSSKPLSIAGGDV